MRRTLLAPLLFASMTWVFVGCESVQVPPHVQQLIVRGNQALEFGNYRLALSTADSVVLSGYGTIEGQFIRARAFFELGEFDRSDSLFQLILAEEPEYPGVRHNLGNIFYFQKQYRLALESYIAEAERQSDPRSWHAVAGTYAELGKLDSAEVAIAKSLAIDREYAPAWASRAVYAEQSGEALKALEYAHQSFALDSSNVSLWLTLARLENQVGSASRSMDLMKRLIQFDPWNYTALYELGKSYQLVGQSELSSSLFDQSNRLREVMQPVELLETSVRNNPSDFSQRIRLAEANRGIQRFDDAARQYQAALVQQPDNLELASTLGTVYVQLGKRAEAMELFTYVLKQDPDHFTTLLNLAVLFLEEQNVEQSKWVFEKAASLNPTHPAVERLRKIIANQGN